MKTPILIFFLLISLGAVAQGSNKADVLKVIDSVNKASVELAIEKLYLQTDKSSYSVNDTLWFKAYLLDATYLNASAKSGLMYIEIVSDSNEVMKRMMVPVYTGMAVGQVDLIEKDFPQGNYTLRAYTNWMRNFGENYVFKKDFSISGINSKQWMINYNAQVNNNNIRLRLALKEVDSIIPSLRKIRMTITDGRRNLYRDELQTFTDGTLSVQFNLPERAKTRDISVKLQDIDKKEDDKKSQQIVPLILNRPDRIDLQFMPEGGDLVATLPSIVAFKAVNEDGYGVDISGVIVDSKGREVTKFNSLHKGMGSFEMEPDSGELYSARVSLPDGSFKTYPLPTIKSSGFVLQVSNKWTDDSCEVKVYATPDLANNGQLYYLYGQSRGIICFGATVKLKNGFVQYKIARKSFPTGIAHFTLSDNTDKIINERIAYFDNKDELKINVSTDKSSYALRDSVAMQIQVTDNSGAPVQGTFSLAVTDDSQVRTDSISNHSIRSWLLLANELKGYIEDPGYYMSATTYPARWKELDNLLLAQGWTGYEWNEMKEFTQKIKYDPEAEFVVKGKVTNAFNKPVSKSRVVLLGKKPVLVMDTLTNEKGIFSFNGIIPSDTAVYFLQSRNKKNKEFNVGIELEEFKPPVFAISDRRIIPWYVNIDTARLQFINKQVQIKKEFERITGIKTLQEVIVEAKKTVKDSKNLNGPGEADQIIGDEELKKAGRTSLGDLIQERVKGFLIRTTKTGSRYYAINTMVLHLIMDGIEVEFFKPEGITLFDYFKQYFDYYEAADIKGIEVMRSGKYQMRYTTSFLDPLDIPWDHAFLEITTRSGHGPFVKRTVGTYLYRPLPFNVARNFYAPKYEPGSVPNMSDVRSTVFWSPNIITDKEGKAAVSFYTADIPGSYSLIIEGSDLNGNIGTKRQQIKVTK